MFGKVFTLVFRECSKARLLVWGYCPQLYLNFFLMKALFCNCNYYQVFVSPQNYYMSYCKLPIYGVNWPWFRGVSWLCRFWSSSHGALYSAPPSPIISLFTTVWWMTQHWGNLNTLSTETRGSIALSNTLDQLGPGFRLPHGAITDTVGGSHVSLWEQKGLNLQPVRHQAILLCSS